MAIQEINSQALHESIHWQGKLYITHAFDVGDDIQLNKIVQEKLLTLIPAYQAKYFKNYHLPLAVAPLPEHNTQAPSSIQIYNFGVISLRYEVPFSATMDELKRFMIDTDAHFQSKSVQDAHQVFQKIKGAIKQPSFFNVRTQYTIIQVLPKASVDVVAFQQAYGESIASALRFETEMLSYYQKNDILAGSFGYYRGDVVIVDLEAAFLYDDDLVDTIELFEFAQIQHLELQFFDRLLDTQLQAVYERRIQAPAIMAYLPFIGMSGAYPIGELEQLKVDISVITERLEHGIQLVGDAYYLELYERLSEKLDIKNWSDAIYKKLQIIEHVSQVYQNKIDTIRGDLLSVAVIVLIFLELVLLLIK